MQNKYIAPEMLAPTTLTQLAQMLARRPKALLIGGGMHSFAKQDSELFLLPPEVIFLKNIHELTRLSRNDRLLEIGACVTIQKLIDQAQSYLPAIVVAAIKNMANMALRNQMTVGGTLALASYRSDLFLVLAMLGARIEVRSFSSNMKKGKIKKFPLLRLLRDGYLVLDAHDVITTIRLPINEWTHWHYVKLHRPFTTDKRPLLMAIVARIEKDSILAFHMMSLVYSKYLVYDYALETQLIGRRYPIAAKEISLFQNLIDDSLDRDDYFLSDFTRYSIKMILLDFLQGMIYKG